MKSGSKSGSKGGMHGPKSTSTKAKSSKMNNKFTKVKGY